MADSQTPNHDFILPEVGASKDTWGNKLNDNWTKVDGLLGVDPSNATFLPTAGGKMTGNITFSANHGINLDTDDTGATQTTFLYAEFLNSAWTAVVGSTQFATQLFRGVWEFTSTVLFQNKATFGAGLDVSAGESNFYGTLISHNDTKLSTSVDENIATLYRSNADDGNQYAGIAFTHIGGAEHHTSVFGSTKDGVSTALMARFDPVEENLPAAKSIVVRDTGDFRYPQRLVAFNTNELDDFNTFPNDFVVNYSSGAVPANAPATGNARWATFSNFTAQNTGLQISAKGNSGALYARTKGQNEIRPWYRMFNTGTNNYGDPALNQLLSLLVTKGTITQSEADAVKAAYLPT